MLPTDSTGGSPPVADIAHPFRSRSGSESKPIREAAGTNSAGDRRRQSISGGYDDESIAAGGGENRRPRLTSGSRGNVLVERFRFRNKSGSPQEAAAKLSPPEAPVVASSSQHRQRSKSTVDRPQIYLTDPAVNRPQVSPTTVESSRAKVLRQRKDLAPQWVKASTQDPSPSNAIYGDTNGQSLLTVPQTAFGAGNAAAIKRDETKKSVFDTNWNQPPPYKNTGRRLSFLSTPSVPLNSVDPEFGSTPDARPRSGSRGFVDFFRIRKKSNTNAPTPTSLLVPSHESKSPMRSPQKQPKRQRSVSTVEKPVMTFELPYQWRQPITVQVFNPKRDHQVPSIRLSLSGPSGQTEPTPMSELLSMQAGPDAFKGMKDFLQLYSSQNSSDSKKEDRRSLTRRSFDLQQQFAVDSTSVGIEDETSSSSSGFPAPRITSGQTLQLDLPESIPEYLEVHQVSSASSLQPTRIRKISQSNQTHDYSESNRELTDRQYGSRRRYSEPPKPNLKQMAVLNSIHMKLVSAQKGGSEQDNNNNRTLTCPAAIANSLGIKIPMTSRHELVLWRGEQTGTHLLKLPVNGDGHQDDLYDVGSDDKLIFVKLMKLHKCHELMPQSAKLVLLDSELEVISAFFALTFNEIKAAPIWEAAKRDFIGMLTVTDFISVLQMHYESPEEVGNLEEHKISKWIDLLGGNRKPLVTVDPDDRLFDAVVQLSTKRIHRILVADSVNGDALFVLSYKRILKFIYLLTYEVHLPSYMEQSIWDLQIGTYGNKLCTVTRKSRLIDVLNLLVQRRISAVPVIDDDGQPINIYAKVDVINLAANEAYRNLDTTIEETLNLQREKFEGVFLCKKTDTLHQVMKWFIQQNVHRLLIVDDDMLLVGIVSLSDIVQFLVIRQTEESATDGDIQADDIDAVFDISL